jgi:hypothetical protein
MGITLFLRPATIVLTLFVLHIAAFVPLRFRFRHHPVQCSPTTQLQVLWDPQNVENDSGLVDFPTSSQKKELRKEAKRRTARKTLPFFTLSDEESNGPWSEETFQMVWDLLVKHEMILIKGICRDERNVAYQTANWFCEEMEDLISAAHDIDDRTEDERGTLPVALLSVNGNSALIYCPTLPLDHPDKFRLRTSVGQKNVWKARVKALRDYRGQIIKEPSQALEE